MRSNMSKIIISCATFRSRIDVPLPLNFFFEKKSAVLCLWHFFSVTRGGSRTAATSKMKRSVIIVNVWKPLHLECCSTPRSASGYTPFCFKHEIHQQSKFHPKAIIRGGSRTAATSKMERFMIIVNGRDY